MAIVGQPDPLVVIAGTGVAASALACLLRDEGFGVILLTRQRRSGQSHGVVIEALPEAAVRLLAEVGLGSALVDAGAVVVHGFDNSYDSGGARRLEGMWTHVDRGRLARECLRLARRRGAAALPVNALGPVRHLPCGGVGVQAGGVGLRAVAAVDATGRAARWSRPVERSDSDVATLYSGPGRTRARPGRVMRIPDGWAYRLEHPQATTVGVVRHRDVGMAALRDVSGVDDHGSFVRVGARSAAVQWSDRPVGPGRLAIGDAALALSPLAGQGVRFAVSSALAAAAVLRSWIEGGSWSEGAGELASEYYRCLVAGVRSRHLAKLAAITSGQPSETAAPGEAPLELDRPLRWRARVERAAHNRGGRIVAGDCCVLPDGGLVRWVGGIDLLLLRDAIAEGRTLAETYAALTDVGVADASARALVAWALRVGAIRSAHPCAAGEGYH